MASAPLTVGILAGEVSGDILGASLMRALSERRPVRFVGVGGEHMTAAGLEALASMERLSVNGFVEPIRRLPELIRLLTRLYRHFLALRPDVFVGVDFNVFNLLLERLLKRRGIATVHYVSPSVYAWRRGRLKRIARAVDRILTLYPFEPPLYADHGVDAVFVGHPRADEIGFEDGREAARRTLGIDDERLVVALLPGSRMSEIDHLGDIVFATARWLNGALEQPLFLVPCVNGRIEAALDVLGRKYRDVEVRLVPGDSRAVLSAADAALVKSGTGTLEALLLRRPMVVTYRLGSLTYHIVKLLKRSEYVALPNILADAPLVPELLQDDARPEALGRALVGELNRSRSEKDYFVPFDEIHRVLRRGAADRAAEAVLSLIAR